MRIIEPLGMRMPMAAFNGGVIPRLTFARRGNARWPAERTLSMRPCSSHAVS
jgi:hypothetical protein